MSPQPFLDLIDSDDFHRGGRLFVPQDERALVLRDGLPERFLPPGLHQVYLGTGPVEIRLLLDEPEAEAPPGPEALELPYLRSYLTRDGALMGVLKAGREAPVQAWENESTPAGLADHYREHLRSCLAEPLRACLPASGVCCGGRLVSAA